MCQLALLGAKGLYKLDWLVRLIMNRAHAGQVFCEKNTGIPIEPQTTILVISQCPTILQLLKVLRA